MQLMGGRIEVQSVYGEGSTFIIYLPQKIGEGGHVGNFEEKYKDVLYFSSFFVPLTSNLWQLHIMRTKGEYIELLKKHMSVLKQQFGIRSMCIFGSVARDEQGSDSDVDVCVEMEPDIYVLVALKQFLEKLFGCSVDVVRRHRNMNKLLEEQIERDALYVF